MTKPKKGYYKSKLIQYNYNLSLQNNNQSNQNVDSAVLAARRARLFKKIYIQKIQQENNSLKIKIQNLESQLQKYKTNTSKNINSFVYIQKQFRNLFTACSKEDHYQIQKSLCFLRDKYGIFGKDRINLIQSYIKSIIESLMPMHYRLLMENCSDNKKFYELLSNHKKHSNQKYDYGFTQTHKQILLKVRPSIIEAKQSYNRLIQKINQLEQSIKLQNKKCQQIVDTIQNNLTPIFVGRLLIGLDNERALNQTIYPINYWMAFKQHPQQMIKIIAQEQNIYEASINKNNKNNNQIQLQAERNFEDDQSIFNIYF